MSFSLPYGVQYGMLSGDHAERCCLGYPLYGRAYACPGCALLKMYHRQYSQWFMNETVVDSLTN